MVGNRQLAIIAAVIVIFIIGGLIFLAPHGTQKESATEVRVGYYGVSYYLPEFVAQEKGYFSDEGLAVTLVKFENATQLMDALLQRKIDYGGAGYPTIFAIESASPGKLKIFGTVNETNEKNQNAFLVKKGSLISSISDLNEKKVATFTGTTMKMLVQLMLKKNGLVIDKDYALIQLAPTVILDALGTGQIDAAFVIEPHITIAKEKGIGGVLVQNPRGKYIMDPFPAGPVGAFSADYVAQNPLIVEKIMSAIGKASNFITLHESEAKTLLPKYISIDENVVVHSGFYEIHAKASDIDKAQAQQLAEIFYSEGELKTLVSLSDSWLDK